MAKKVQLLSDQGTVLWPNACADCCRTAPTESVLAGMAKNTSTLLDAAVGTTVYKTAGLHYPVCKQHSGFARLSTWLTRKSILPTLIRWSGFLMGVPSAIVLGLKLLVWLVALFAAPSTTPTQSYAGDEPIFFLLMSIAAVLALVLTIVSYRRVPIRIIKMDEDSITLRIKSDRYARHFVASNEKIIVSNEG